jgi:hypothetical protein
MAAVSPRLFLLALDRFQIFKQVRVRGQEQGCVGADYIFVTLQAALKGVELGIL